MIEMLLRNQIYSICTNLKLSKKLITAIFLLTFSVSVIFTCVPISHQANMTPMTNTIVKRKDVISKEPKILLKSSSSNAQPYGVDFSTYFSSISNSFAEGVAVDGQGNIYVTGYTNGGLPLKNAWNSTYGGDIDAFLAKFNSSGYLLYSTYLGGSFTDRGNQIAVDSQDNVFIYGTTASPNLPVRNAYQSALIGVQDTFLAEFDSNGYLVYATYFGVGQEQTGSLAELSLGKAFISGATLGNGLPMKNANQNTNPGNLTGFVAKFDSQGGLVYSTYLGGNLNDIAYSIAVDSNDNAYIVGTTSSSNFPTTNDAYQKNIKSEDAFLSILNVNGSLSYSTFIGGTNSSYARSVFVDDGGNIYITGQTYSADFPITNDAYQSTFASASYSDNAFIMKFSSSKTLLYSTFLGGLYYDEGYSIKVDSQGNMFVTGMTTSSNFPVKDGVQNVMTNNHEAAFITELSQNGSLIFSSYYGGLTSTGGLPYVIGRSLVIDKFDNIIFAGETNEVDFPTQNAYYPSMWSSVSAVLVKFFNNNEPNQIFSSNSSNGVNNTTSQTQTSQTQTSQTSQQSSTTNSSPLANSDLLTNPIFEGVAGFFVLSLLLNLLLLVRRKK